jgi:hypothetical protein
VASSGGAGDTLASLELSAILVAFPLVCWYMGTPGVSETRDTVRWNSRRGNVFFRGEARSSEIRYFECVNVAPLKDRIAVELTGNRRKIVWGTAATMRRHGGMTDDFAQLPTEHASPGQGSRSRQLTDHYDIAPTPEQRHVDAGRGDVRRQPAPEGAEHCFSIGGSSRLNLDEADFEDAELFTNSSLTTSRSSSTCGAQRCSSGATSRRAKAPRPWPADGIQPSARPCTFAPFFCDLRHAGRTDAGATRGVSNSRPQSGQAAPIGVRNAA